MRVTLLHPELGYGGSERVMLDIARALAARGDDVVLLTHRVTRPIEPREVGGAEVRARLTRWPRHLAGRGRAALTVAGLTALAWAERARLRASQLVVLDLAAHVIPALHAIAPAPVLFYCHYPDARLAPASSSAPYAAYRRRIDALERRGLRSAACVVVNSAYTRAALAEIDPRFAAAPIVAPGVDAAAIAHIPSLDAAAAAPAEILTLARFSPAKNLPLAIDVLAALRPRLEPDRWRNVRLTIAGGLAAWRPEEERVVDELASRAAAAGVADRVRLLSNVDEPTRLALLARATCLLHPATGEHFGLAVIEAMAAARPVIAVRGGGVTETIADGETGWLCDADAGALAGAVADAIADRLRTARLGTAARAAVAARYSRARFDAAIAAVADVAAWGAGRTYE